MKRFLIFVCSSTAQTSSDLTEAEIENSFDGNICRCTGYRPIFTGFKKFASDAPSGCTGSCDTCKCKDVEDLCCKDEEKASDCAHARSNESKEEPLWIQRSKELPLPRALQRYQKKPLHFTDSSDSYHWFAPTSLADLLNLVNQYDKRYAHVYARNLAAGVTPGQPCRNSEICGWKHCNGCGEVLSSSPI